MNSCFVAKIIGLSARGLHVRIGTRVLITPLIQISRHAEVHIGGDDCVVNRRRLGVGFGVVAFRTGRLGQGFPERDRGISADR